MELVKTSRSDVVFLSPEYFTFVEAAVGTIGDQQVAMGLRQRPQASVRLTKTTHCPFCDAEGYTVRVVWHQGSATAQGFCAVCGTRCESRWLRGTGAPEAVQPSARPRGCDGFLVLP